MNAVVVASDVVSTIAFVVAGWMALSIDYRSPLVTRSVRYLFAAAMGLYAFVGASNILEHAGVTSFFDMYEDFAEILFVPALAYVVSTAFMNKQMELQAASARMMRHQNDLLLNIVDTVPGGILVVGPSGAITFANEGAEHILGMASASGGSTSAAPDWVLADPSTAEKTTLAQLASGGAVSHRPLIATWSDGTQTELVFSSTPMLTHAGELGGSIIAFEAAGHRA